MRDKKTEPVEELPSLTDKQMAFVIGILEGKSQAQSYRDAYDCKTAADSTIWANASRLASDSKVQAWLAVAKRERFELAKYSVDQYMKEQQELYEACRQSGNMGAAAKVHENIGKVAGYYVTQVRDLTPRVDKDLIKQLENLFGHEAAMIAAQRLGYKDEDQYVQ